MTAPYLLPPMLPPYPLVVTQRFGHPGPLPPHAPHTGIDLQAAIGLPICAVGAGRVEHYFRDGQGDGPAADGTALCVLLDMLTPSGRGLARTWWLHLSRALVKVGDVVRPWQIIGYTGATGEVTGPHLHFQVEELMGDVWTPVDPAPRFLPLQVIS